MDAVNDLVFTQETNNETEKDESDAEQRGMSSLWSVHGNHTQEVPLSPWQHLKSLKRVNTILKGSLIILLLLVALLMSRSLEKISHIELSSLTPSSANKVLALVANQRIEQGVQLQDAMFTQKELDRSALPASAFTVSQKPRVMGQYTSKMIPLGSPITAEDLTDKVPTVPFKIPTGYRAVTIMVDARSGVEGFATPNSRVDVLWFYEKTDSGHEVRVIVPFAKVLSVSGRTKVAEVSGSTQVPRGMTTVTLLVTSRDAKKIELAQKLGSLSLSLVGDEELQVDSLHQDTSVTLSEILGQTVENPVPEDVAVDGVMETRDPRTGKSVKFVLKGAKWNPDEKTQEN